MVKKLGFTLIEIIIVVAIIGILAIGLITALNPVEQINRATDTTTLSLAREFLSSTNQYQTNQQFSAACPDLACATYLDSLNSTSPVLMSTLTNVNVALRNQGTTQASDNFINHGQAGSVSVSLTSVTYGKDAQFILCWQPKSNAIKSDATTNNANSTIYNNMGVVQTAAACPADNSNTCYRCLRQ